MIEYRGHRNVATIPAISWRSNGSLVRCHVRSSHINLLSADKESGKFYGTAFLTFKSKAFADKAVAMNGNWIMDRAIKVPFHHLSPSPLFSSCRGSVYGIPGTRSSIPRHRQSSTVRSVKCSLSLLAVPRWLATMCVCTSHSNVCAVVCG